MQGKTGKIISVTGQGIWSRNKSYFNRSPWAGKIKIDGSYVLDGTVNNPLAHLINNCIILLMLKGVENDRPDWVRAELYRANEIESEDTSCLKIMTLGKVEIYFVTTIAAKDVEGPFIIVEGSEGSSYWNYDGEIRFYQTKSQIPYESLTLKSDAEIDMYDNVIDVIKGKAESVSVSCTLETARNFVLASNLAFESSKLTHKIDDKFIGNVINLDGTQSIYIKDINELIHKAVKDKKLYGYALDTGI